MRLRKFANLSQGENVQTGDHENEFENDPYHDLMLRSLRLAPRRKRQRPSLLRLQQRGTSRYTYSAYTGPSLTPCTLQPVIAPTRPAQTPGYTELDPTTDLHMTGTPQAN